MNGDRGTATDTATRPTVSAAAPATQSSAGRVRTWRLVLALQTALAALLVLPTLGRKSLWLDEGFTLVATDQGFASLWQFLTERESNMAPHYLLTHLAVQVSDSAFVLRLPSALLGIAAVPLTAVVADRLVGRRAAVISGFVLAVHPLALNHSQEARGYSTAMLMAVTSALLLVLYLERDQLRWAAAWAPVAALAVHSHYLAGLAVVGQLLAVLAVPRPWRTLGRLAPSLAVAALLVAPLVQFARDKGSAQIAWIDPLTPARAWRSTQAFSGDRSLLALGTLLVLVLVGLGAAASVREVREGGREEAWRHVLLWGWLLLPPLTLLAAEPFDDLWLTRYLLFSLPALVVVVSSSLARLRGRSAVLAGVLLAVLVVDDLAAYQLSKERAGVDWRVVTAAVIEEADGRPLYYSPAYHRNLVGYYAERQGVAPPEDLTISHEERPAHGWLRPRDASAEEVAERLRQARRDGGALLLTDQDWPFAIEECLRAVGLRRTNDRAVGDVVLADLVPTRPEPGLGVARCR